MDIPYIDAENIPLLTPSTAKEYVQDQLDTGLHKYEEFPRSSNEYNTFHGFKVTNILKGGPRNIRVVRKVSINDKYKAGDLGTIVDEDVNSQVEVQWDKHKKKHTFKKDRNNQYELLLLERNGVHHSVACDECSECPLRGIKWTCQICADYDLCTNCYMNDAHNLDHLFKRYCSTKSKGTKMTPRMDADAEDKQKQYGEGIIKESSVQLRRDPKIQGIVLDICESKTEQVWWKHDNEKNVTPIVELKLLKNGEFSFYPAHLPVFRHYPVIKLEVDVNYKKIEVVIWRSVQWKNEETFDPSLYLIFANPEGDKSLTLLEDVVEFAKQTKLPCHITGHRVLYNGGTTAFIHHKTEKDIVKKLTENGILKFERMDIVDADNTENEIRYFKRMAEYEIGEEVLPVIISIQNGGITQELIKNAAKSHIPIIRLKRWKFDFIVLWPNEFDDKCQIEVAEYKSHQEMSHRVKKSVQNDTYNVLWPDEITLASQIKYDVHYLINSVIVGGYMEKESWPIGRHEIQIYLTALSMFLLKKEMWKIPKMHVKMPIDQRSLEYIYEEVITAERIENIWYNKKSLYQMDYMEYKPKVTGSGIQLTNWDSECYGHIFFALLHTKKWKSANQLIDEGYIGINHILVGCAILEDKANSWETKTADTTTFKDVKITLMEQAVRITNNIYNADRKTQNSKGNASTQTHEMELGAFISHAGRLLVNHGYLREAIDTKNTAYFENETVKNILNEMWIGSLHAQRQTIPCLIVLAAVHLFVLPLLMINMEARPLRWFYTQYKLPILKVITNMLGFLFLLIAYAYMLLFDYRDDGISNTDWFIIMWMTNFLVDESKQVIVAFIRDKLEHYKRDWGNILDWILITGYTTGMLLRAGEGSVCLTTSKCLLVAAFMLLCIRLLNLCCMTQFLGSKLVIIKKMLKDTISFMIIMTFIMVWYSVSYYALLYPNSEFSWKQIEQIVSNGYWILFGELNLDGDTLTVPYCTFNRTIYEMGALKRCPTQLGVYLTPYLKAFYGLIAVLLMLNLLVAIYSDTFNKVQEKSDFYWRKKQIEFLEEFSIKTVFPIHLQILALPGMVCAIMWCCHSYLCGKPEEEIEIKLNHYPMIVRVFIYNTNYDLVLPSTKVAEVKGANLIKASKTKTRKEMLKMI